MSLYVVKLGGGAGVDHAAVLKNLAERIAKGERWVLVHGCSDAANKLAEQVGYPPQTITSPGGHTSRYTDARTLEIFSAAAATVNQMISTTLQSHGIAAIGLASPAVILAERKKAIRALKEGRQVIIRDDYSGKITSINAKILTTLLDNGFTPVVAPLGLGDEYERLNVDGDLAAAHIAQTLHAEALIILSNVPGLLKNVEDPSSLIPQFALRDLEKYGSYAAGRMKKKLIAAQTAAVKETILADSRVEKPLDEALNGAGTHIVQ